MLHPIRCLLYNSILSVNPGIEFKLLLNISGITGIGISIPVAPLTGIPGITGNTVSALLCTQHKKGKCTEVYLHISCCVIDCDLVSTQLF